MTEARRVADEAAARAGVIVEQATGADGLAAICSVVDAVWHPEPGGEPLTPLLLRALGHTGNYCALARVDDEVVGVCVGFLAVDPRGCLHSHVAGVTPTAAGRQVGFALKVDQRAWALERGIPTVEWTFDPLVRRNAYFNCIKLGAVPTAYLTDFYGAMHDRTNLGQGSDRLVATWNLTDPAVRQAVSGTIFGPQTADLLGRSDVVVALQVVDDRPVPGGRPDERTRTVLVEIPEDIEALRRRDPDLALRWRHAVREALTGLLAAGWTISGTTRDGCYLLHRDRLTAPTYQTAHPSPPRQRGAHQG